jgi:hypothetical protein
MNFILMLSLILMILAGCKPSDQNRPVPFQRNEPAVLSLGLTGYNYTDREISEFFVNGQGGGNIAVSSPGSSGGGTVCCVPYVVAPAPWTVKIRWQSDACYYHVKSTISDEVFENIHWFYKERDVVVETPALQTPRYMEVHFYPDGSVKAAVTEHASTPRVKLQPQREIRTRYPRCPDDREPVDK